METIVKKKIKELPVLKQNANCNFEGYDALLLMSETAKLRNLITKRGTRNTNPFMLHNKPCQT